MKKWITIILLLLIYQAELLSQINDKIVTQSSLSLILESGATFSKTDYTGTGRDYLGRLSLEYIFPSSTKSSFGLKFWGSGGYISGSDNTRAINKFRTDFKSFGVGIIYSLSFSENSNVYLLGGISSLSFDPKGENGVKLPNNSAGIYKTSVINYNGEFGFQFGLTENMKFVINAAVNVNNSDYLDDLASGLKNDIFISTMAGLSFTLSSKKDSDKDGVEDSEDKCPNTPQGVIVDEFGCPIDTDKDGIADYLDICPNTPPNIAVDLNGCPLDSDKDGIPDFADLCNNTPIGIVVDEYGCPFDLDADGVPDYKDKCPNTPSGTLVSDDGCPIDSDKDGVPDNIDQCPDTPQYLIVDSLGCPKVISKTDKEIPNEIKTNIKNGLLTTDKKIKINYDKFVISVDKYFDTDKPQLLPSVYTYLDLFVDYMKKNILSRWRIEGYTDNIGLKDVNQKKSFQKAEVVMNYFVSKGISKQRINVVGLGESFPVADNSTKIGRSKNRRIVIIRTN